MWNSSHLNIWIRMYDQGHFVLGVEGVEQPILEFFQELNLKYNKKEEGSLSVYSVS